MLSRPTTCTCDFGANNSLISNVHVGSNVFVIRNRYNDVFAHIEELWHKIEMTRIIKKLYKLITRFSLYYWDCLYPNLHKRIKQEKPGLLKTGAFRKKNKSSSSCVHEGSRLCIHFLQMAELPRFPDAQVFRIRSTYTACIRKTFAHASSNWPAI